MKVAVCISGAAKFTESGLLSLDKLKNKYDIDVFIHTWNITDFSKFNKDSGSANTSPNCLLEIIKKFNPCKIIIEDYSKTYEYLKNKLQEFNYSKSYNNSVGPLSMFYSINKCNELKNSHHEKYDMNIRMRFDSYIRSDVDILQQLDNKFLHIPELNDYNGINDQFAFGKTELMDVYCNVINDIIKTDRQFYHPETILRDCLLHNSIPINRFGFLVSINDTPLIQ